MRTDGCSFGGCPGPHYARGLCKRHYLSERHQDRLHLHGKRRAKAGPMGPDDPRHGTVNGYSNLKCRCAACQRAWSREHTSYMNWRRKRLRLLRVLVPCIPLFHDKPEVVELLRDAVVEIHGDTHAAYRARLSERALSSEPALAISGSVGPFSGGAA